MPAGKSCRLASWRFDSVPGRASSFSDVGSWDFSGAAGFCEKPFQLIPKSTKLKGARLNFPEKSRMFQKKSGIFRMCPGISRICPEFSGIFLEITRTFPGNLPETFLDISWTFRETYPGYFQDNS